MRKRIEGFAQRMEARHLWLAPVNKVLFGPVIAEAVVTRAATGRTEVYRSRGRLKFESTST